MTTNDVLGRSLRVKAPGALLQKGLNPTTPGYQEAILELGRVTPPVDSYLEQDGRLYWVFYNPFAQLDPISYYLEHAEGLFEVVPAVNPGWTETGGGFNWILPGPDIFPKAKPYFLGLLIALGALFLLKRK